MNSRCKRIEAGESPEIVTEVLGFHRYCIYDWIAKYRESGFDDLKDKPIPGAKPKLNGLQLRWHRKILRFIRLMSTSGSANGKDGV